MKWLLICAVLFSTSVELVAQSHTAVTDSLEGLLEQEQPDSTKLQLLNQLAWEIKYSQPERAIQLAGESVALAEQQGDYDALAKAHNTLGVVNDVQGNYDLALDNYLKSLRIRNEHELEGSAATTLNNIGLVYMNLREFDKALNYFEQALEMLQEVGHQYGIATILGNIGNVYLEKGLPEKALEQHLEVLSIVEKLGNQEALARSLSNIGNIESTLGEQQEALRYHERALQIWRTLADRDGETNCLNNIGAVHNKLGGYSEAIRYLKKGLEEASKIGLKRRKLEAYDHLVTAYSGLKDYRDAMEAQRNYYLMRDTLFSIETEARIKEISASYEDEQQRQELENLRLEAKLLEKSDRQQQLLLWFLGSLAALVALFALLIYNGYKRQQRTNIALQKERNRAIQINKELDTFVYRASHDLMSPLASLEGIINLVNQEELTPEIRQYVDMMSTSTERLHAVLNDLLIVSRIQKGGTTLETIGPEVLCNYILESLQHMPGYAETAIHLDFERLPKLTTDPKLLTSVLQNLIANSIKYRQKDNEHSSISIIGYPLKDMAVIEVSDNGQGIPDEFQEKVFDMFFRASDTTTGTGLGLYIVKSSVEKMGGSIAIDSSPREGTTVAIRLPLNP